jgi:radical SAM superfamily enzyme YgiQ (UPF0313 family)
VRSPEFIRSWLDNNMHRMDGPSQFLGDEPNAYRRAFSSAAVCWLMCASWDYSQASGNMSVPAVYEAIHAAGEQYMCDRWYLPATPRDMAMLERAGIPVFGIESKHELADFDVVGTSISYTVLFMNFVKTLQMSGIPLRWKDRQANAGDYPMVIVGGQAYCAPEFMAPVVDCVWLGEVEHEPGNPGMDEVLDRIAMFKQNRTWREDRESCYSQLALEFNFLYFPRYTVTEYAYQDRGLPDLSRQVCGIGTTLPGMKYPFRARKVQDMDKTRLLTKIPLIYSDPQMGGGDLEVARGCPAWCGFCRLSWVTKPYRQEDVARSVERAKQWRLNMGSVELSPFGPDLPMHTRKKELYSRLMEEVADEVDASSMRIDDYLADEQYVLLHAQGGADSLTLGLEGSSQRMRDLAGKGTSDADVEACVIRAIRAGVRKLKLYMISNWPGEDAADTERIVRLGNRLADVRDSLGEGNGVRIQFSFTPLLIEAQTPLQWFAPTLPDYNLQSAILALRERRIDVKLGTKAQPEKLAFFQACQRASRDAGEAITDVLEAYGTASWGAFPKDMRERLDAALKARGFRNGLDDLFGERFEDDMFGWEHIDTGVSRKLMWQTYQRMLSFVTGTTGEGYDDEVGGDYHGAEFVPRCDQHCSGKSCGACSRTDLELRQQYLSLPDRDMASRPLRPLDQTTIACRVRVKLWAGASHRYVSAEHWRFAVRRAAYRAREGIPGFPQVSKRSIRLASEAYRFRDWTVGADYADIGLTGEPDESALGQFGRRLGRELEEWISVMAWKQFPAAARLPQRAPTFQVLELEEEPARVLAAFRRWEQAEVVPVKLKTDSFYAGTTAEDGDAKEHVHDMWLSRVGAGFFLCMVLAGRLGPYQAAAALLGKPSWLELARNPAVRQEFFTAADLTQGYLLGSCDACGLALPENLLGEQFGEGCCPRCQDEGPGGYPEFLGGLRRAV